MPNSFMNILFLLIFLSQLLHVRGIPIDNGLIGSEVITECVARRRVDLGVILDGSGSIGDLGFEEQKNFLNLILEELDIGRNATHVAVVQFSDEPRLELRFGAQTNKLQLQGAVARIPFLSGTTLTGRALAFALDRAFSEARGGDVPKVLLVLTDGQSQDSVKAAASALRAADILIYAIGITNLIDANELLEMTGSPSRVFTVVAYEELDLPLSKLIIQEMCRTQFLPGEPEIICESERIGVRASTKRPFQGHVFVKGHYNTEECRRDPGDFVHAPTRLELSMGLGECGVRRYRSLEPRGVFVEATVVFMFHDWFMTKVDQAVNIQCFYMEADKTVDVPLEVSMLTTEFAERMYPMPRCTYSLRSLHPDGPEIEFATVGDKVFHRWECVEHEPLYDIFGMLVHDCVVDDSNGDTVTLIDEDGCGSDLHLVATPEYRPNLRVAVRETHVFKYADRPVLEFQCQITICYKHDGSCDGLTPPVCDEPRRSSGRKKRSRPLGAGTLDVLAPQLTVTDITAVAPKNSIRRISGERAAECSSAWSLVAALLCAVVLLVGAVLVLCCRRLGH